MSTPRPTDDAKSSRAAQRAERLGRLRATALCTVIENPTPRGLPAGEPAIIAGGDACQEEIVADMAWPLAELPAVEPPSPPEIRSGDARATATPAALGSVDDKGKGGQPSDVHAPGAALGSLASSGLAPDSLVAPHPLASQLARLGPLPSSVGEEIAKTALWSNLAPPAAGIQTAPAAPSSAPPEFAASKSPQPPMAQPSSQVFRLDSAEGLSPRPPFAMPAFTLAKNEPAQPPEKATQPPDHASPSAYPVGELYRQLRHNVLGQLAVGQAAMVWICPTGSEPLSDHLVELASALAEGCDGEILLVDANFQSAALTRRFNLGDKSGLADVMAKKLAAHAAGHETAVARVRVLPKGSDAAGRAPRRANEEEWKSLLAGLKERYRYVLIDAPGVEEPHCLPLAKAADAAFVAIALDHTPRETVQEALEHLHLHKARVAGCVITDAPE